MDVGKELWIIQTSQRTICVVVDISRWLMFQMITKNFEDYPEHRLKFFSLLRAIATHCFPALIRLSSEVRVNIFVPLLGLVLIYTFQIWQGCNLGLYRFRCVCLIFKHLASTVSTVSMSFFWFYIYLLLFVLHTATKASYGFYYLGFPAHWEEHIWNGAKSFVGDAEELSGVICHGFFILFSCFTFISRKWFLSSLWLSCRLLSFVINFTKLTLWPSSKRFLPS